MAATVLQDLLGRQVSMDLLDPRVPWDPLVLRDSKERPELLEPEACRDPLVELSLRRPQPMDLQWLLCLHTAAQLRPHLRVHCQPFLPCQSQS